MDQEIWTGLLTLGAAGAGGFFTWLRFRKKDQGDAATAIVAAAAESVAIIQQATTSLEKRVGILETERTELVTKIIHLEKELEIYMRWNNVLVEQVIKSGHVPVMLSDLRYLDGEANG